MKLTDFALASEPNYAHLGSILDGMPTMKTYCLDCELPPDCMPNRASLAFFKHADLYALMFERPVVYRGKNPAMLKLAESKPQFFPDMGAMQKFFQSILPESVTKPGKFTTAPPDPNEYDINQIVRMDELTIPTGTGRTAPDYKTIQRELEKNIMGQETATEAIAHQTALHLNKKNPKKPLSIVAWGSPGTGKTETAKALSKILTKLTGRTYADVKTDLNTYTEAHSVYLLTGAPPGYVGYGDTPVFEAVANNPYTIFIFDELDKAHPEVLKTFMSILDEGRLSARKELADGSREYDFRNCIFIFTSNYQLEASQKNRIGFGFSDVEDVRCTDEATLISYAENNSEDDAAAVTNRIYRNTEAARKSFVSAGVLKEIASRFNLFVEFKELSAEAKVKILVKQVIETAFEYDFRLAYISSEILQALINASSSENALTVRSFKSVIEGYLAAAFAEAGENYAGQTVRLTGTIESPELIPS